MAKTKKQQQQQRESQVENNKSQNEEAAVQFENLKNLNKMLLIETKDRRKQVEALVLSKGSLEASLTLSQAETESLRSELNQLLDRQDSVEMEKMVVSLFVEERLGTVERQRDILWREKSEVENKVTSLEREVAELGSKAAEINVLRLRLGEIEKRMIEGLDKINLLKKEKNGLMIDKEEREGRFKEVTEEKGYLERCLEDSNRVVEKLKGEIEKMGREMVEHGRVEREKIAALENDLSKMNELLLSLRDEDRVLRCGIVELERRGRERTEEVERKTREMDVLVRVNKEMETKFLCLVVEKGEVGKSLKCAVMEIDEVTRKLNEIGTEKMAIEAEKKGLEGDVVRLNGEISALRAAVEVLEAEDKEKSEQNKELNIEINRSRDELARVTSEKDDTRNGFEAEREIRLNLSKKVSEMEKKIEETEKVLTKIKMENQSIHEENSGLIGDYDALKRKVVSLEDSSLNDKKEIANLRADLLKKDANMGCVLKIVKGVRVGGSGVDEEGDLGEEIRPFVDELEAIRREMREGEAKLKETRTQVDLLNSSVEAHKKKSFWAVVSSTTTILVAASVASAAYIARGH